jgi:predicted ATP-dependent serine protease
VSIDAVTAAAVPRLATGVGELDRVLGGGLVAGSVTLLGGEPGVGKSTLLLQALAGLAASGGTCLLVSAEESPEQVRLRAARVGALDERLLIVAEPSIPAVLAHVDAIDSRWDTASATIVTYVDVTVARGFKSAIEIVKDRCSILFGSLPSDSQD